MKKTLKKKLTKKIPTKTATVKQPADTTSQTMLKEKMDQMNSQIYRLELQQRLKDPENYKEDVMQKLNHLILEVEKVKDGVNQVGSILSELTEDSDDSEEENQVEETEDQDEAPGLEDE